MTEVGTEANSENPEIIFLFFFSFSVTMLLVSISDGDSTGFIFASSLFPMCMLN